MIAQSSLAVAENFLRVGDYPQAEHASRLVVKDNPWVPRAWFVLAVACQLQRKLDESMEHYRMALALHPYNAESWNNLGVTLLALRRSVEAETYLREALYLDPRYEEAHNNLGNALQMRGLFPEAEACYHRAIELNPRYVGAHDNLGLVLQGQNRIDEALAMFDRACELDPDNADVRMNRAYALLQKGDFVRGWEAYEARWNCNEHLRSNLPLPIWEGQPLAGKTILIRAEQGIGDSIQFLRFIRLVAERDACVAFCCPPSLFELARSCPEISKVYPDDHPPDDPDIVCQAALMSLPYILGTASSTLADRLPYFTVDPARAARWAGAIPAHPGLKVGIAWQGNPGHKKDYQRSFPLARFEPLAAIPGVRLFSLQRHHGADQLETLGGRFPITDLGRDCHDVMDTAAAILNLDMVIACDTAVAHMAAALNKPTWILLPFAAEWRWLMHRPDSPWYPSARLFRQPRWGDWDAAFGDVTRELAALAAGPAGDRAAAPSR
ncbi:lipoprotein NlpI [Aquisphaera giovannonii]|uniref:Lipoprotein NlpI n=1 Tax=Aquisphaera giovannonii TaxID=406548 RepID=A0A5B9W2G1_9BACT|nr:tetratricopeptide repeat-containing glycosyltransferase family protein [Aquisphaera giovannonii]QEH34215.1 lipoprotein NlpI [Aquisphaera giovannonii]